MAPFFVARLAPCKKGNSTVGSKKQAPLAEKLAYTVAEAGSLIGVCQRTVYSLIESGELKSVKFRKTRRVTPEAIREMLANSECA